MLLSPQSVHLISGQALPPLLNQIILMANGEDTESFIRTVKSPSFLFQVVKNNYTINQNIFIRLSYAGERRIDSGGTSLENPEQ